MTSFYPAARSALAVLVLPLLVACGNAEGDSSGGAGGSATGGSGGGPLDAGLQPDANLSSCVSDEEVRLCGTMAGCFEDGPECECSRGSDGMLADLAVCGDAADILESRPCGFCYDGQVCVDLGVFPVCASESLGRLFWEHGGGDRVWYADGTPYTGEAIPEPTECPQDVGDLEFCGGACGGCGAEKYCSGRSPTHPWGICQAQNDFQCVPGDCGAGEACLRLNSAPKLEWAYPSMCVNSADCAGYEAAVAGGVSCE